MQVRLKFRLLEAHDRKVLLTIGSRIITECHVISAGTVYQGNTRACGGGTVQVHIAEAAPEWTLDQIAGLVFGVWSSTLYFRFRAADAVHSLSRYELAALVQ